MKKLVVSLKNSSEVMDDFKKALKKAKAKKIKEPHYEISFDSRERFEKFARNIFILSAIIAYKPNSVYELAQLMGMDLSNLNKIIIFLEEAGAISVKRKVVDGREVKTPTVDYSEILIDLK